LRRDRQIARYLAARGGVMTDELDRSISVRIPGKVTACSGRW
jgi:hypothetical protein